MGSRSQAPWAATSVPEIRRQWCAALDSVVAQHSEGLKPQTGPSAGTRRMARMQASLADTINAMATENDSLRSAQLFWVSRNMTDVVVSAAETLPEWTPAVAAPRPPACCAGPAPPAPAISPNAPGRAPRSPGMPCFGSPDLTASCN